MIMTDRDQRNVQLMLTGTYATTGALVLLALTIGDRVLHLSPSSSRPGSARSL